MINYSEIEEGYCPEFSTAGFFSLPGSPRKAFNFNVGWKYYKGSLEGAYTPNYDDSEWESVNIPHGLELLPLEASGCKNYQGEAWYRKSFDLDASLKGEKLSLHFEAIMGKSSIWINGKKIADHFGGFLPIIIDITDVAEFEKENVLAVLADNSDDPNYPPGKEQTRLDFTYFGGIYRDVWLVQTEQVYVTDPNAVDHVAGGGVCVNYEEISKEKVKLDLSIDIANESLENKEVEVNVDLQDVDGKIVGAGQVKGEVSPDSSNTFELKLEIENPHLWHVDDPYLHNLLLTVTENSEIVDSLRLRIGLRSIEFRNGEGFFLNGKLFEDKLIGANRHQDFAHVGNALSNSIHWRDARKLREAGMRVIRSAHYPQDPAFLDACDELGLFVIGATPGWQFWNDDSKFEELVIQDVRNMVRRDRNRPSVFLWEPILNESNYPLKFAKRAHETVHEEYPFSGCYTAADHLLQGGEFFDVKYSHVFKHGHWDNYRPDTPEIRKEMVPDRSDGKCTFTREWGDCVDDFNAHNSPSRVSKSWGEIPQLVQLEHYANPDYIATSWDSLYDTPATHVGGALWHSFDHQRGYHPDPFWGGIMDAYRQPKYSYYMFKSQVPPDAIIPHVPTGPFVYIAHEMTPFSPADITVVSNCDEVRLFVNEEEVGTQSTKEKGSYMPHHPLVFKDAYEFLSCRNYKRPERDEIVKIKAEGLIDGKVVAFSERQPSRRVSSIQLTPDFSGAPLVADGGDFVVVIAHIVDQFGIIKRLSSEDVVFWVEGEGTLIDDGQHGLNPQETVWGEAIALVRAGTKPGKIIIHAKIARQSINGAGPAELIIESIPSEYPTL